MVNVDKKDPWLGLFETRISKEMKQEEEKFAIINKRRLDMSEIDANFEAAGKFPLKKYFIQYDADHGPDPVTCKIGTAHNLRAGDDLGERLPGSDFDPFDSFLAINDRDLGGADWWIESRTLFIKKAKEAGWTEGCPECASDSTEDVYDVCAQSPGSYR